MKPKEYKSLARQILAVDHLPQGCLARYEDFGTLMYVNKHGVETHKGPADIIVPILQYSGKTAEEVIDKENKAFLDLLYKASSCSGIPRLENMSRFTFTTVLCGINKKFGDSTRHIRIIRTELLTDDYFLMATPNCLGALSVCCKPFEVPANNDSGSIWFEDVSMFINAEHCILKTTGTISY